MKLEFIRALRKSVVIRHGLLLFSLIALVLGSGFYFLYHSVRKLLLDDVRSESALICQENVNHYDQMFLAYEGMAKVVSDTLADTPAERWKFVLKSTGEKLMRIHPEIRAVGAMTLPNGSQAAKLILASHQDGSAEVLDGETSADRDLYDEVMKAENGIWREPFHGPIVNDLIAVYAVPMFGKAPEGGKKPIGIACLNISIDWLNRDVNGISLEKEGYVVLLSSKGQFLSSKFAGRIGKRYCELPPDQQIPRREREKVERFMREKKHDGLVLTGPDRKNTHFYFRQMKTTGWTFIVAFPEDVLFSAIGCFESTVLLQILCVVAVLLLSAFLLTHRISLPLHKLACFAESIGKGDFSAPIPVARGCDEISDLMKTIDRMRYSLIDYIRSVQKITELEAERTKNRKLLLNTLPEHVIDEFILTGKCTPEYAESVTVFFSDIVGFTTRSSELPAAVVIEELNSIFSNFDRIFVSHGVERIKTIGDAYMAIAGLHPPKDNHCDRVLDAAQEARRYLRERNATSKLQWQMRIGVHTGSVAAGIVGVERYVYDVFGDAVNTAARMEQNSEPMKINVSEAVRQIASNRRFTKRTDKIEVKGKGLLQMYFLEDDE